MSVNLAEVKRLVSNGTNTHESLADALGVSASYVGAKMKAWTDDGEFYRVKAAGVYEYSAQAVVPRKSPEDVGAMSESAAGMPVVRDYDWDLNLRHDVTPFVQTNGELDRINAILDQRNNGVLPHFLVGGPTGSGKTTLAETVAAENEWPMFTIQCEYSMYGADLVGSPAFIGNETVWIDATLTKAMLCAAERPTVLLIDEANRARPEAKSVLFSALDHRATVFLPLRGNERIRADPANLIVFATINEGSEYYGVQRLDLAEKRRLGFKFNIDYLGLNDMAAEANLITARSGVSEEFAMLLVSAANDIRNLAKNPSSQNVTLGVPTAALIEWGQVAEMYARSGVKDPAMAAGRDAVIERFYGDTPAMADEVESVLASRVGGLDPLLYAEHIDADTKTEWARCTRECDYLVTRDVWEEREDDDEVLEAMDNGDVGNCPNCGHWSVRYTDSL